jgi:hypothetical protein
MMAASAATCWRSRREAPATRAAGLLDRVAYAPALAPEEGEQRQARVGEGEPLVRPEGLGERLLGPGLEGQQAVHALLVAGGRGGRRRGQGQAVPIGQGYQQAARGVT